MDAEPDVLPLLLPLRPVFPMLSYLTLGFFPPVKQSLARAGFKEVRRFSDLDRLFASSSPSSFPSGFVSLLLF